MKLYTEEQVRQAIKMADKYHHILDSEESEIISILEPIELPSDEEIDELFPKTNTLYEALGRSGMIEGAKWMRDKIQGGNK
jgi:hypothetical protein